MAKEILAVPEEKLLEVIAIIRAGLETTEVSEETREQLTKWCDEEEAYIKGAAFEKLYEAAFSHGQAEVRGSDDSL